MNKCTICSKELHTKTYCEMCAIVLGALNTQYNITQLMELFSHIIGSKITKEITENMYQTLKDSYDAEKLKDGGMLN